MLEIERPTLFFIPGISGSGKSTMAEALCRELCRKGVSCQRVVGYTIRALREGEVNGVDYRFINEEDYEKDFLPQINAHPDEWDVDKIGRWTYFNRIADTIPNERARVKILPIHWGCLPDMRTRYERFSGIRMVEFPIAVDLNEQSLSFWRTIMAKLRPNRCIDSELEIQVDSLNVFNNRPIFVPTWSLDFDKQSFVKQAEAMLIA